MIPKTQVIGKNIDCDSQNNCPAKMSTLKSLKPVVIFCGRRDFADVMKLRISAWRDYPGLSLWAHYIQKDPYENKRGGRRVREGNVKLEPEGGRMWGHKPVMCAASGNWTGKEMFSLEPPEGMLSCQNRMEPIFSFWCLELWCTNLCWYKPMSL